MVHGFSIPSKKSLEWVFFLTAQADYFAIEDVESPVTASANIWFHLVLLDE